MIHLVIGISSSGKSSYINSQISSGAWPDVPILMAHEVTRQVMDEYQGKDCIIHYNLFRTYGNSLENIKNDILSDPLLQELLRQKQMLRVSFLITPRSVLIKRILLRTHTEQGLRTIADQYPMQQVAELLFVINLEALYKRWFSVFQEQGVPLELIHASDGRFLPIPSVPEALSLALQKERVPYTEEEINFILTTNHFEYQQVYVSASQATQGQDRSGTLQLLDDDLTGKTMLDIGCAYGYFCFEAEKRKAARVVGTELKRHRFLGANILKEILGSRCEFYFQDIFTNPVKEKFDIVLFLNVIHHLHEPMAALRIASNLTREKMIFEFPTLSDEKFLATLPAGTSIDPRLPLIGVSLIAEQGQTFLFNEEAVRRILMEQNKLFRRIDFQPSPMAAERSVAICYK